MKEIPLTQGFVALIDDTDYERVAQFNWSATKTKNTVYAIRKVRTPNGRTTSQLLHRLIMGVTDPKIEVHHKDHCGLNCQRSNLCRTVRGEHDGSRRKSRGASQYKGVSFDPSRGMWRASISVRGRSKHLGRFREEIEAALAYDAAARANFGVFAYCNFPS